MEIPEYDSLINTIACLADRSSVIGDIRIYTNRVLVRTGKVAVYDLRGMPGFIRNRNFL